MLITILPFCFKLNLPCRDKRPYRRLHSIIKISEHVQSLEKDVLLFAGQNTQHSEDKALPLNNNKN